MTCLSASFNFTQHGTDNLKQSVTMMMTATALSDAPQEYSRILHKKKKTFKLSKRIRCKKFGQKKNYGFMKM